MRSERDAQEDLARAVDQGDFITVEDLILSQGNELDLDASDVWGSPLLCRAARRDDDGGRRIVKLLCDNGCDIAAVDYGKLRTTALHAACLRGDVHCVEIILQGIVNSRGRFDLNAILQTMPWSGRSWHELVHKHVDKRETEEGLVGQSFVVMAITKPDFSRETAKFFPKKLKFAAQTLLCIADRISLNEDLVLMILTRAAYPLSSWL
ncbi:hypothetical protein HOP50_19g84300 [Chloropicon primus]|uniref:Uncharacterized protein n=1 Tax=Chloropicon primus TaxID=1764295 RepID=A0A5B8N0V0_9CHLO|nr:hypothetical protein A3770_19p84040 [Chloropicon primus]UPR05082.1 hypothetical protein HOP50_19g84300 [Chloropicon primus]|mmetsp:Transcript_2163/g.5905  ORF Transcript_2163/g.5905 Transcript_2163/m.5905 type:complete len:208 (+) Transcript_2163:68-691(+)|eukprot:QDZ25886.1 hypothetical protein A3770_19p84040 [Chloropicon primus]